MPSSRGFAFLKITLFLLWATTLSPLTMGCLPQERRYLREFKAAVVDEENILESWKGLNCCEWTGISCSRHSGHVTALELGGYELRGEINSSLFKLAYLEHLDLSNNFFKGISITSNTENLKRLTFLDLSLSTWDLSIPRLQSGRLGSWLKNQTSLEYLSLNRVDLSSTQEWGEAVASLKNLSQLSMSDCILSGPHLPSIFNLSKLWYLDLSLNSLTGGIPPSLAYLSKLVYLDLSLNQLTGEIPPSLAHLSSLVTLYLDNNKLNGTIPTVISGLASLEFLSLSHNRLSGAISFSFFDNLIGINQLYLSYNRLSVSINSTWIPKFEYLQFLQLASCNLAEFPSFLVNQYYLQELDISANSMAGNIPTWIWGFRYLYHLNLSCNQFTGSLPSRLVTSEVMTFVDLHNNSLQGALPLPPPGLLLLDLSDNQFSGSIPSQIGIYVEGTRLLSFAGNNLSGGIPSSLCTSGMEVLDLSKNNLSGGIPNFMEKCLDLRILNLAENHLEGHVPEFKYFPSLHTLNLNSNGLQGALPSSTADCRSLEVLDLGRNNLEGTVPEWIGNLSGLKILRLSSNRFQGNIRPKIIGLPNLQILDLSDNRFSGSIPTNLTTLSAMVNGSQDSTSQLGYRDTDNGFHYANQITISTKGLMLDYKIILTIFKFVDLSNNNLSGDIPAEMGSLRGLIGLNLSKNHLSGRIPKSMGDMEQLESLDLSINKLNGTIPLELQSLSYLQFLNLSYNMLDGKVPHGGQFLTFENSSYLGNGGLYDIPFTNTTSISSSPDGDGADDGGDSENEMEIWWLMGVGICYVVAFTSVIGMLAFSFKVRQSVFNLYDVIIVAIFQRG